MTAALTKALELQDGIKELVDLLQSDDQPTDDQPLECKSIVGFDGYSSGSITWADRNWRVNAPCDTHTGHEHSIQRTPDHEAIRFEIRPSDEPMEEPEAKRRSELSGGIYGDPTRLPNGVPLWGAFTTIHHEPELQSKGGGVYGQIHMGAPKGNPALAFRREPNGNLKITTNAEGGESTTRHDAPLSWDEPHDIVYRVKLHKRYGQLAVWIDGKQVVDLKGEGVGHSAADYYWTFGLYYSAWSELAGPVVAEYANHVYPSLEDLMERIASPMEWPGKGGS